MNSKTILWFIIFMFIVTSLPVWGVFANQAIMFGPLPMVIAWSYFGFLLIMVSAIVLYYIEFKPWAERFDNKKGEDK
jgi:hypothetical protein